ncbi:UNVERIFIED_CONTAM: hypothetical protein ABIC26_003675 [Paenibacillus sp. PvR008]
MLKLFGFDGLLIRFRILLPHAQEHAVFKYRILSDFLVILVKSTIHSERNITGPIAQSIRQIVNIFLDKCNFYIRVQLLKLDSDI